MANGNTYFPGEKLGFDEMRISFVGSTPVPPTGSQAGTAIMVELGNGKRFFFDVGPGCLRKISWPCRSPCRWSHRSPAQGRYTCRPAGRAVTKVEYLVNLRTAKTLGQTFPLPLIGRADEVIE